MGDFAAAIAGALRRGPKKGASPHVMRPAPTPASVRHTPVVTPADVEPRADQPVEVHALRLLIWVQQDWRPGDEILARDLEIIYREMASELWWNPLRWRHKFGVAHAFRLINGEPLYRWSIDDRGQRHRWLAYPIRPPARSQGPARVSARRRAELCLHVTPPVGPVRSEPVRHVAAACDHSIQRKRMISDELSASGC